MKTYKKLTELQITKFNQNKMIENYTKSIKKVTKVKGNKIN